MSVRRLVRSAIALGAVALLVLGCTNGDRAGQPDTGIPPDPAVVKTAAGWVRGVVGPDHRMFAGIPYAAPPVGPLRWQPPAPVAPWSGMLKATKLGQRCLQDLSTDLERGKQTGEDCLTLNVWTPPPSNEPRPVMVWFHGGAFVSGSSGIYDAQWLASRGNLVVVTLNYRLGALGFLAHPALGPPGDVGNYGLQDQQAALRWVRDNIADFGGDPAKVTVAGESAGGVAVCDHLVAPGSAGLFRAAIIQSAPCQAHVGLPEAERKSIDYARDVGCPDPATAAACLRALPADKLRNPVWYYHIGGDQLSGPVSGTAAMPLSPMEGFASGNVAKVPVLIGTNHDEFTLFVAFQYLLAGKRYTAADYPKLISETFGTDAAAVEAHYPLERYGGSTPLAYSAAVTDGAFACVADRMTTDLARTNPVFAYEFNDLTPPTPDPLRTLPFPVGASHSLELRYLFDIGGAPALTPDQQVLSDQMIAYWSQFVAGEAPVVAGQPAWPAFQPDGATEQRLSLQPDGSRLTTDFDARHQCDFWATLGR